MKYFLLGFCAVFTAALLPELAFAGAATDETAIALNEELYTVITYSGAVFVFVIGWLVGTLT